MFFFNEIYVTVYFSRKMKYISFLTSLANKQTILFFVII